MSTQLLEYIDHKPLPFQYVRDGIAGNSDVVVKMIRLVRDSVVLDKGLEDYIKGYIAASDLTSNTPEDVFKTVYDFVRSNVKYIQDIQGRTETIKDARTTLEDGFGDCDDQAILNATILGMLGYEPMIAVAKYDGLDDSNFQHVYAVTYLGGERFVFDTTLPNGELNDEVEPTDVREIGVFDSHADIDSIRGIISEVKNLAHKTGDNAVNAVQSFSGLLPLGIIPSYGVSLGAAMLGKVIGKAKGRGDEVSLSELGSQISGELTDIIVKLQNHTIAIEVAQQQAKAASAQLYWTDADLRSTDTFKFLEDRINDKLEYILNYGQTQDVINLDSKMMTLLGIAAVGVGALILFNKDK